MIITGQIFSFAISSLCGLACYNTFVQAPKGSILAQFGNEIIWPVTIMGTIQALFTLYGPVACAAELLICQMIHTLTEIFHDWEIFLKNPSNLELVVIHKQTEIKETAYNPLEKDEMYVNRNIK